MTGPSEGYSSISGAMSKSRNTVVESQAQAIEEWLMKQNMGNVHDSVKKLVVSAKISPDNWKILSKCCGRDDLKGFADHITVIAERMLL